MCRSITLVSVPLPHPRDAPQSPRWSSPAAPSIPPPSTCSSPRSPQPFLQAGRIPSAKNHRGEQGIIKGERGGSVGDRPWFSHKRGESTLRYRETWIQKKKMLLVVSRCAALLHNKGVHRPLSLLNYRNCKNKTTTQPMRGKRGKKRT